ncbi:MAG: VRR-NUC domain-containing protein [Dehalococcoidia bacterium]|nr:VRR-NUC domain-containing protein [Dehalococcoidia bacterium]
MREQRLEQRLRREIERRGGKALKFTSPGWSGAQDRLVLLPDARVFFLEVKAPGRSLSPLQDYRRQQLQALGFHVWVISTVTEMLTFLTEVDGR